jgi:protoporphyrinogen oxidase
MHGQAHSFSQNMTRCVESANLTVDTIVLGAGPAGIGAAIKLGRRAIVLERSREVAGLCRTVVLDGAVFDLGGHSFHTPHEDVRRLVFDALPMERQRREAWCLVAGSWIAYPFQQHFAELQDAGLRASCARDLAAAGEWCDATNFDTYLDLRFGRGIAEAFLRPYNAKLWGADLSRISAEWTSERLAAPAGTEQRFAEKGGLRLPLQADTSIAYPARGGFGEIYRTLALGITNLRLGQAAVRIDPVRRTLQTNSGQTLGWRQIVSTIPLPALLAILTTVPAEIADGVAALEALPVHLVMVVLERQGQVDRQRVYCAGHELPGHKVIFNHTSSTWLREKPRHGILMEAAGGNEYDRAVLAQSAVSGLVSTGLISRASDVRRVEVMRLGLGYPVPTHARPSTLGMARDWLEDRGIIIAGRFAEWAYINSDEALARGLEVGDALVQAA